MRSIVHFMTIATALGCGARSELASVGRVDASVDAQTDAPVLCPSGPASTPLLVAHTGLQAFPLDGAPRTAAGELVVSLALEDAYRIVALDKCGKVREIVAEHPGEPMRYVVVSGDELFASDGASGVYRAPVSGGPLTMLTSAHGPIAVDQHDVYVGETDHVTRVPRTGGAAELFVSEQLTDIALDDTYVYLGRSYGVLRVTKNDPTQVVTLALPEYTQGYWWSAHPLALDATRVFYLTGASPSEICAVPKSGGIASCSQPIDDVRGLLWSGALYYRSLDAVEELSDVDAGPITLVDAGAAVFWVDDSSVWWLTADGDLHRVDK